MKREKFFEQRQHYYFGEKKPEKTVERKDSVEPDGRHKIELSLAFDNEEEQKAVLLFIAKVNGLHEVKDLGELTARTNWLNGYIAALHAIEALDYEQAEQLANLLEIASKQQARILGVNRTKQKGW
jgi:hypothetical protein